MIVLEVGTYQSDEMALAEAMDGAATVFHQAALASELGAARVLGEQEASPENLRTLGEQFPIDCVVETVGGSADTLRLAGEAVRPGGIISVVGVFKISSSGLLTRTKASSGQANTQSPQPTQRTSLMITVSPIVKASN